MDYDRPFMAIHLNDPRITREVHRRTELCVPVLPLRQSLPVDGQLEERHTHAELMRVAVGQR